MNALFNFFFVIIFVASFSITAFGQHARIRVVEQDLDLYGLGKTAPASLTATAYPNPSNGYVRLAYSLEAETPVTIALYDLQGREIQSTAAENQVAGSYEKNMDISNLSNGYYLCRIATAYSTQTVRLLKVD